MPNYNQYRVRPAQGWGPGVTKRKHVAEIFAKQPIMLNDMVVRAYTGNFGYSFSTFLQEHTSVREFESDEEFTWKLIGSTYKNIPLIEARDDTGAIIASTATNVGRGGSLIQLVFPEAYFADGEVIVGNMNEYYQFRIIDEPIMEGPNAVYTVELMAGGQDGVPGERLQAGELFSWEFAPVESELSRKAGGIRKAVPTTLRNEWTTLRKYHKFTGAADRQLRLDINIPMNPNSQGKPQKIIKSWFDNESWIFVQEWEKEKERARFFSRSNRNANGTYLNHGKSGGAIKEGDGIMAQMLYGNTHYYNGFNENFSITGLANAIYDICEQGNVPLSERTFVIITGSRGMIQVNNAIMRETAGFSPAANVTVSADNLGVISKVKNEAHQTSLAYGAQFVEYRGANGMVLKFLLEPALDDRERNKISGPNGQGVLSSYAYYCFDMGSSAQPNMYLCKVKGYDDTFKYRLGLRNPWGITNDNVISHDEDSAEIHTMTTLGACILDPTRCLAYLPSGLVA